jgi:hypothetical protein
LKERESQRALINGLEEVKLVDMVYSTKGSEYITSQSINMVSAQIYPYHEIIDPENVPNVYGVTPNEINALYDTVQTFGLLPQIGEPANVIDGVTYLIEKKPKKPQQQLLVFNKIV